MALGVLGSVQVLVLVANQLKDLQVAHLNDVEQRRLIHNYGVVEEHLRILLYQVLRNQVVGSLDSEVERTNAIQGGLVDICTRLDQHPHEVKRPLVGRDA